MLISELRNRLALFMDSADYQRFLESEVKKALEFAQDAPMTVYLDPSDEDKLNRTHCIRAQR